MAESESDPSNSGQDIFAPTPEVDPELIRIRADFEAGKELSPQQLETLKTLETQAEILTNFNGG